jgi:uncharacterized damage-inducible protein DinB
MPVAAPSSVSSRTTSSIAHAMLHEFESELPATRRFLERIPEGSLNWQPHEKSMTAGQLALHIAQSPAGALKMALADDAAPPDFSGGRDQPASLRDVLAALDECAAEVRRILPGLDDDRMARTFTITLKGRTLMSVPRAAFLRSIMLNHTYHHRGQLGVYLRLLGVKVPSSYGPSGDEGVPGME